MAKQQEVKEVKEKKVPRKSYTVLKKANFGWGDIEPGKKVELCKEAAEEHLKNKTIK